MKVDTILSELVRLPRFRFLVRIPHTHWTLTINQLYPQLYSPLKYQVTQYDYFRIPRVELEILRSNLIYSPRAQSA